MVVAGTAASVVSAFSVPEEKLYTCAEKQKTFLVFCALCAAYNHRSCSCRPSADNADQKESDTVSCGFIRQHCARTKGKSDPISE